jgi:hypothetical protein
VRPQIVGAVLEEISRDSEVSESMFEILEIHRIIEGQARITLLPQNRMVLADYLAARSESKAPPLVKI